MQIERPKSRQPIPEHAVKVFSGILFDVYQWKQKLFDGTTATFEKISRKDTVLVIPVTDDGKIIVLEQEQPGKPPFLSFAGGQMDKDEDPILAVKRELLEETGYESEETELFFSLQPQSKIDWAIYYFIARNCKKVAEQNLDGGERIRIMYKSFDEVFDMITSGQMPAELELTVKFLMAQNNPRKKTVLKKKIMGV